MLRIDANVIFHCLALNTTIKPIIQKKQEIQEEIRLATYKEEKKLKEAHFIREIKYTTWLSNIVMVEISLGKMMMCVDFTNLKLSFP